MAAKIKYAKHAADHRDRALDYVGESYPAGWCLRFCLTEIYGAPGVGDWDGDGAADAEDYAKALSRAGLLHRITSYDDIPAGALVLWTGGRRDHGHAAYCLGGGEIVSTDLPKSGRVGRVPATRPETSWGLKPAGWTLEGLVGSTAIRLTKTTKGTKPKPAKVTRYLVTARSGLRGRAAATTMSRTLRVAPYGSVVESVDTASGGGLSWAVTADGTHYALKFLRPA